MLAHLRIKDLVLIDELNLELSRGFNALTGETGAGKSLIATAVDLLLGRRASAGLVRKGREEAEVEGLFDISDEDGVKAKLAEAGLPVDDELLVRRVIPASGRHRCFINGRLASLNVLSELAQGLASVMSQHEQHTLLDPARQLALLDGFARHDELLTEMDEAYFELSGAQKRLDELRSQQRDRASRLDFLRFQLEELENAAPEPGEVDRLEHDVDRLRHLEELRFVAERARSQLYEDDGAVVEILGRLAEQMDAAAEHDEKLLAPARQLAESAAVIEDVARAMRSYASGLDGDPEALAQMEGRLDDLRGLIRKHGVADVDSLIALTKEFRVEVERLEHYEEAMDEAHRALDAARKTAEKCAERLSRSRRKASVALSRAVSAELMDLQFAQAGCEIVVDGDRGSMSASGCDRVELLVALNPGEGAHPLRKVASGGELSRLLLAVKRALAGVGPVGTYVFDEVDSGIGGAVAAAVGRKLSEVARHHQVICITHLPQIAGMADAHFFVTKQAVNGRTATSIQCLLKEERVEEMARMLGGHTVTENTRQAARELLSEARQ